MSIKSLAERFGTLSTVTFSEAYSIFPTWHVDDQYSKYSFTGSSNLHEAKNKIEQSKIKQYSARLCLRFCIIYSSTVFFIPNRKLYGKIYKKSLPKRVIL